MTPQTDIIISVRGTRRFPIEEDFKPCVESVVKHTSAYRFIFVDDNSDAVAAAVVSDIASQFPTSVLIRTHRQNWFTRAYNKGLRLVRTPWAVLLNADTVVDEGWLDELYACRDEAAEVLHKPVGLVGSDMSQEEPRRWVDTPIPGYVTGHCWLVGMEPIFAASNARGMPGWYLDEQRQDAIHIKSDVYMCWDLQRLGYSTIRSHKAKVGHIGGRSWGHLVHEALSVRLDHVND